MQKQQQQALRPKVKWAQKPSKIFITVALRDIKNEQTKIQQNTIQFTGESDNKKYQFTLQLNKPINANASRTLKTGANLVFQLQKLQNKKWSKLTLGEQKYGFVEIDWDRWEASDDDQDGGDEKERAGYKKMRQDDDEDELQHNFNIPRNNQELNQEQFMNQGRQDEQQEIEKKYQGERDNNDYQNDVVHNQERDDDDDDFGGNQEIGNVGGGTGGNDDDGFNSDDGRDDNDGK